MSWLHHKMFSGAISLAASAFGLGQGKAAGYGNAEVSQAYKHWSQQGGGHTPFMFLDVRSSEEFTEAHIAGAIWIPVQTLASRLNEIPQNVRIYVYCHSGGRSAKASTTLTRAGYSDIENVLGGMKAWQKAGYPTESY